MKNRTIRILLPAIVIVLTVFPLAAQEDASTADFGLNLGIGSQTFLNADGDSVNYQELTLAPDFAIGKFGIALDLTLHFRFIEGGDNTVEIRREDWVPDPANGVSFLDLYLPKFRYVRYGFKGDPLFVKVGAIDDATLGTGFIMGGYDNTLFRPEEPVFGMNFDLDGSLFSFPYVGIETFAGNLTSFDVLGVRILGRPLIWSSIPIVKNLEIGFTVAGDIAPDARPEYWAPASAAIVDPSVVVWGADLIQPIISSPIVSLAAFAAIAFQPNASGGMVGFGGKLFSFLPYGFQLRFLGDNFLPAYFDSTYDLTRGTRYLIANSESVIVEQSVGWLFSTGLSFFEDQLIFNATIDGPFRQIPAGEPDILNESYTDYPHLSMVLNVAEGLLPGFFFNASYDKKYINEFADLIDPTGAVIGASINYKTGPAVITLGYDLKYNPEHEVDASVPAFSTTAKLSSSISMF